jgi:hypothetical protein
MPKFSRTREQRAQDNAAIEDVILRLRDDNDARRKLVPTHDRRLHCKVAGVTYCNHDGSSRQDLIGHCAQFERVVLQRDREDQWDFNCVQVFVQTGRGLLQVGNLPKEISAELAPDIDAGARWEGIVTRIAGYISKGVGVMLYRISAKPDAD